MMNGTDWQFFIECIARNYKSDGGNFCLKFLNIYNSNIIINNDQWKLILNKILNNCKNIQMDDKFAVCLHIIIVNNDFEIIYSNLSIDTKNNMPLPPQSPYLKASFISENNKIRLIITASILRFLLQNYHWISKHWDSVKKDPKQNPKNWQNFQEWFFYTYFLVSTKTKSPNISFWIDNISSKTSIIDFWDRIYNQYYLTPENKCLNFKKLLNMTSDNTQILNIS